MTVLVRPGVLGRICKKIKAIAPMPHNGIARIQNRFQSDFPESWSRRLLNARPGSSTISSHRWTTSGTSRMFTTALPKATSVPSDVHPNYFLGSA